jgi:hypothetical protein
MTTLVLSVIVVALFCVHPGLGVIAFVLGLIWLAGRKRAKHDVVRTYRPQIPAAVKQAVWDRDGGRCVLCGTTEQLQYDHVIPWSKGGADTVENLRLVCARENQRKGATIGYA